MKKQKGIAAPALILIIVVLIGGAGVFFLVNNSSKKLDIMQEEGLQEKPSITAPVETWEIQIVEGDIYKVHEAGDQDLLIGKNDIEDESIQEFLSVKVSPDKSKICFIARSIVPLWVYYANVDGSELTQVGLGKNCVWSNDGLQIAYNNHTTDVSPVDVYVYNLISGESVNYTSDVQTPEILRAYDLPVWDVDDKSITSEYSYMTMDGTGESGEGFSVIDMFTGEVIDK